MQRTQRNTFKGVAMSEVLLFCKSLRRQHLQWLFLCFMILTCFAWGETSVPDWENPEILGINKEKAHSTLWLAEEKDSNPNIISLNGTWKFNWSPDPNQRVTDFYRADFDCSGWNTIRVPGNWQMQGYGLPVFVNIPYPFLRDEPRVTGEPPKDYYTFNHRNPVGSYCTTFQMPEHAQDQLIFLCFGGVESAMYVWVNGRKVGFSKGSMTPAEFDITAFVQPGQNKLAVEVYRFSDGSYLEDIDMWRLSGIFRDVELVIRPKVYIQDFFISAVPDPNYRNADVRLRICLENRSSKPVNTVHIEATIDGFSKRQQAVQTKLVKSIESIKSLTTEDLVLETVVPDAQLWSSENPVLYDLHLVLKDETLRILETVRWKFGIKKVEVKGEHFLINGQLVKLKGVNRHEHHPRTGRHVDRHTALTDIRLIKQANINMIRTSHYPNDPYFYQLCDEYGLYVMDEANNESHGYGIGNAELGDNPRWEKAHVDRAVRMVERDKNHACVILWSLGNEAGRGRNIHAMANAVRTLDSSRPVYYDSDRSVSAIYDEGYLHPGALKSLGDKVKDRPVFLREYLHTMGNSGGNLQDYWDVIYADTSLVGGAIWDWVDQAIIKQHAGSALKYIETPAELKLRDDEFFAYGGDFGKYYNDGANCLDGIVSADRSPQPEYYEVQKVYQPVHFKLIRTHPIQLEITNRHHFISLENFDLLYQFTADGKEIGAGKIVCGNIPPGRSEQTTIPLSDTRKDLSEELLLTVCAQLKTETLWAESGFRVAREQFVINRPDFEKIAPEDITPLIDETETEIAVTNGTWKLLFNKAEGSIKSWTVGQKELLCGKLEPYFWKPANDNQKRNGYNERLGPWKTAAENRTVRTIDITKTTGFVHVRFTMQLPAIDADYSLSYTINGKGRVQVEADYAPKEKPIPLIPKFGMRMRIPSAYNQVTWYGRGPYENYPDRKTGSLIGLYCLKLENFMTHYAAPQDNANRCDVRWFSFSSFNGDSIKFSGLQPLCFRAWNYTEEDLEKARHPYELPSRDFINLNIDLNIHGVGGNDSWGARTMDQYTNPGNRPYRYGFIMEYLDL
jgi:beta-galactosidase